MARKNQGYERRREATKKERRATLILALAYKDGSIHGVHITYTNKVIIKILKVAPFVKWVHN